MKRKDLKGRWRPGLLLALTMALGVLVLAACGGSSSSSSSTESSSTTSASGSEGSGTEGAGGSPGFTNISEEARACLKEKGVELPEFKGGEGGTPPEGFEPPEGGEPPEGAEPPTGAGGAPGGAGSEKMQKAFKECGVEMPEFKGGAGGKGAPEVNSASFRKQVKKYVTCVRENGYELAEPNFSGEGPIFEKSESGSAAFKKASAKCQSLLSGASGSGGESGT